MVSPCVERRSICAEGDSFSEPYLAAHNVLNAHARAVSVYRTRYKRGQGGVVAMTLNCDWGVVSSSGKTCPAQPFELQL